MSEATKAANNIHKKIKDDVIRLRINGNDKKQIEEVVKAYNLKHPLQKVKIPQIAREAYQKFIQENLHLVNN